MVNIVIPGSAERLVSIVVMQVARRPLYATYSCDLISAAHDYFTASAVAVYRCVSFFSLFIKVSVFMFSYFENFTT